MFTRFVVALFVLVMGFVILGADQPKLRKVSPTPTSPASGKQMFEQYCASCHGKDGKGGGPAVAALKTPPPDLTTMAKRSSGTFPELRVYGTIYGDIELAAHGSKDMPVWGAVFRSMARDGGAATQMRVANLTNHIRDMQTK
jgi:mono/diheme cytochrome c family protein